MSTSASIFSRNIATLVPRRLRGWVLPTALLGYWWAAYFFGWTDSQLFVPVQRVFERAHELSASGELWLALSSSLGRMAKGFVIGASAGLVFGGALGLLRLFDRMVGPTFHTLKQISLFAWIPLISVWFGMGEQGKVVFLALSAFFPVVLNTYEGVRGVAREFVEVGKTFAFSRLQVVTRIVLPAAMPSIFTGIYLALIYSWLACLGAEYLLSAAPGIGTLLIDGQEHFWMDQVLLGVIIVGAVGLVLNLSASFIESRLLRWRGASTASY